MKIALHTLFALFILSALAAAGFVCRTLWQENRRLLAEMAAVDVERLRFATGKDLVETELRTVMSDREQVRTELLQMRTSLEKRENEVNKLRGENASLSNRLCEIAGDVAKQKNDAKKAAESRHAHDSATESSGTPEEIESLKDLLNLTEKAIKKAEQK